MYIVYILYYINMEEAVLKIFKMFKSKTTNKHM